MGRDPAQVRGRGGTKAIQAGGRQHGLGPAGIGHAGVPLHEAVGHETVDESGHAALAEQDLIGEPAHADPPVRGVRDVQQRVVFRERQVVLGAQLVVEAARDAGVRQQERPPGPRRGSWAVSGRSGARVTAMAVLMLQHPVRVA